MSKMEYMPVDCLQVPKVLFQMELCDMGERPYAVVEFVGEKK